MDPAALIPGETIPGKGTYSFDLPSPVGTLAVLRQENGSLSLYDKAEILAADDNCPPAPTAPLVTPSPITTPTGGPLPTTGVDVPVGSSPATPQAVPAGFVPDTTPVPGITGKTDAERIAELEAQLAARDTIPGIPNHPSVTL